MSLEFLNDLIWWAVGSGGFTLGFINKILGGGGGNNPKYPIKQIKKAATAPIRGAQKDAYGTKDPGTIQKVGNKFAVVTEDGRTLKTFNKKDKAQEFINNRKGDPKTGKPLVAEVDRLAGDLETKINEQADALGRAVTEQEQIVLDRLDAIKTDFNNRQEGLDETLTSDINSALGEFEQAVSLLNETDRAEFNSLVSDFRGIVDRTEQGLRSEVDAAIEDYEGKTTETLAGFDRDSKTLADEFDAASRAETDKFSATTKELDDRLRGDTEKQDARFREETLAEIAAQDNRGDGIIGRFDTESKDLARLYRDDTEATTSRFERDSKTLGDTFLSMSGTSTADYNKRLEDALDLSPERLNIFTQASDFIAKAALQTRMDMLATADPRALELSAIADENAAAMMSGRISADVQANLARSSAMRALSGGFGASSAMGQGLAARDLGLTSLDLMRQGTQMYDAQRRLNYDTRVAGVAEGAGANAGQLLANDQTVRRQGASDLLTAETDRNRAFYDTSQRSLAEALGQRNTASANFLTESQAALRARQQSELLQLNTVAQNRLNVFDASNRNALTTLAGLYESGRADAGTLLNANRGTIESGRNFRQDSNRTVLGGTLAMQDTVRADKIGLANNIFSNRMASESNIFQGGLTNLANRTNRNLGVASTGLATRGSLAEQLYNTNTANLRQQMGTDASAAEMLYRTNIDTAGNMANLRIGGAQSLAEAGINTRTNAFNAVQTARNNAAGDVVQAYQNKYTQDLARAGERNAGIGSLIGMGGSVIGGALGAIAGSAAGPMGTMAGMSIGSTLGGMAGSTAAGQMGYGGYTGGAQGAQTGSSMMGFLGGLGQSAGGGLNSAGFYGGQTAAANAYNVAPSKLSYQSSSGLGGLFGSGSAGGYYYNPSGSYRT